MKTIESIYSFYQSNVQKYSIELLRINKKIYRTGTARLILLLVGLFVLWYFRSLTINWLLLIGAAFVLPFLALVIIHNKQFARKRYVKQMVVLNDLELKALDNDCTAFDGAQDKMDTQHDFAYDLDFFGEKSIFQSINRTVTGYGREYLVNVFKQPFSDKNQILARQEAIRELQAEVSALQHFQVLGKADLPEEDHRRELNILAETLSLSIGNKMLWKILQYVIPLVWIVLIALFALNWISGSYIGLYLVFALIVVNLPAKKVNKLYQRMDKSGKILNTYARLFILMENRTFQSKELNALKDTLLSSGLFASSEIKRLSRIIGALDQRFSLAGILSNMLYLRDIRQAFALEKWYVENRPHAIRWLDALGHYDALVSMAVHSFNHPDYTYPLIEEAYFVMEGKQLGHPLLHRNECVKNDVSIKHAPGFLIITGANMAGKSTYLRTVGVNFVLACTGLPVCADSLTVCPASLVTSLRTADSLTSGESYFFAELKRLKMIIDRLNKGERLFIILDEILKGTNSLDKQKGSLSLMKQLVNYGSCGIIATHDLVLGTLINDYPKEIANHCFEADIHEEELSFSYLLREGVAQNMNASFLMKKMGITLD